jgi:hypothetical protein
MNKLQDLIIDALSEGMNKKVLLLACGMDEERFDLCVEFNKFTPVESKEIRKVINEWYVEGDKQ